MVEVAEEEAVKVSADWMVNAPEVVFQVEAAAAVIFNAPLASIALEPIVMVEPIVVVPT